MSRDQVTNLSVNILKVHPENTKYFDDIEGESYERFKKSIKEDGIITPLIVAPDMTIISGHQRYQAAKDLGIELVPAIIRDELIDEDERMRKLLASNFGRMKNNPMKQSRVISKYEELMGVRQGSKNEEGQGVTTKFGMTQKELADELGVTQNTITNLKKLQTLSPELQQLIEDGEVRYTTALNVWGKLSNEEQAKFIEDMGKEQISNITAKETQKLIDDYKRLEEKVNQYKNQQEMLLEENKFLKDRGPKVIEKEKEVVPDDVKVKLAKLEQIEAELEELRKESKKTKDFGNSKRAIEREISKLQDKRTEQYTALSEIELLVDKAEKKQSDETARRRFTRRITMATDELKKQRYNIEEMFEELRSVGEAERRKLTSEAEFLEDTAKRFRDMAGEYDNERIIEGEIVDER